MDAAFGVFATDYYQALLQAAEEASQPHYDAEAFAVDVAHEVMTRLLERSSVPIHDQHRSKLQKAADLMQDVAAELLPESSERQVYRRKLAPSCAVLPSPQQPQPQQPDAAEQQRIDNLVDAIRELLQWCAGVIPKIDLINVVVWFVQATQSRCNSDGIHDDAAAKTSAKELLQTFFPANPFLAAADYATTERLLARVQHCMRPVSDDAMAKFNGDHLETIDSSDRNLMPQQLTSGYCYVLHPSINGAGQRLVAAKHVIEALPEPAAGGGGGGAVPPPVVAADLATIPGCIKTVYDAIATAARISNLQISFYAAMDVVLAAIHGWLDGLTSDPDDAALAQEISTALAIVFTDKTTPEASTCGDGLTAYVKHALAIQRRPVWTAISIDSASEDQPRPTDLYVDDDADRTQKVHVLHPGFDGHRIVLNHSVAATL